MTPKITVATLNLLNDMRRWEQRRRLIVDGFKKAQPDLIALQEVVLPQNTASWLARELDGYSVHVTPKTGALSMLEGIAILSRLPLQRVDWLDLGAQNRVAQMVVVDAPGGTMLFANAHLYWNPVDTGVRLRQVRLIQAWVRRWRRHHPRAGIAICGDFNATPDTGPIQRMYAEFKSAYVEAHGREPYWTCPTPLQFSTQPWRGAVMKLAGMATTRKNDHWRGTLDYIFVNDQVRVRACHTAFTQHAEHDPTLFASDHLGLVADIVFDAAAD